MRSISCDGPPVRRASLYSNSPRPRGVVRSEEPSPEKPVEAPVKRTWRNLYTSYERQLLLGAAVLLGLLALAPHFTGRPVGQALSQEMIDSAVARSLAQATLPSPAAKAYAAVQRAVVRVRAIGDGLEHDEYMQRAVGTGVVIVDNGTVLTSLHVVAGASRVRVLFAEGLESEATVVAAKPEHDLAVLRVETLPDDLVAATLGRAKDLVPGDKVVAIGFPFGIGPSVSAGVVSGLGREYQSKGEGLLSNLIQFDAAVNPGSSGGPLVNAMGEVVGIVTAMLDPGGGGFAGIGFAVPVETASSAAGTAPF
jgi:S1-C subfamily serine protease